MARIRIAAYTDYREYLAALFRASPREGYGLLGKLAGAIQVQSSFLSQVFSGNRELSLEQALAVAEFFSLTPSEEKYFVTLVQIARAGTPKLKAYHESERKAVAAQLDRVRNRVKPSARELTEIDQAVYYSDDAYVALWLLTGIPGMETPAALSAKSGLSLRRTTDILDFLVSLGLCSEKDGSITQAVTHTHIPDGSRWVNRHHTNWRLRALSHLSRLEGDEVAFTAPLTLARKDLPRVREELLSAIERVSAIVKDSPSEELACLNLDFFRVFPK